MFKPQVVTPHKKKLLNLSPLLPLYVISLPAAPVLLPHPLAPPPPLPSFLGFFRNGFSL